MSQPQFKSLSLVLLASSGFLMLPSLYTGILETAVRWVVLWAIAESVLNWALMWWAAPKSNTFFFGVFFGGMMLRLMGLAVSVYLLHRYQIPPMMPLLILVAAYFVLTLVQLPFFTQSQPQPTGARA